MGAENSRLYSPVISEHFKNNYSINKNANVNYNIDCMVHQNEGMDEYIYNFDVNLSNSVPPEFIFIIDRSGSMGSNYNFIISKSIPEILNSLGYDNRKIHLITFDSSINYKSISKSELSNSNDSSGGSTYMSGIFRCLELIFDISKEYTNNLRILIVTDGEIHDRSDTIQKGQNSYNKYKNIFKINSQVVRLSTNYGNIEAEGIMSILKFNNVKPCHLVEYNSNDLNNLANVIIPLFIDDGLNGNQLNILVKEGKIKNYPWEENTSNKLPLNQGKFSIFSDKNQTIYIERNNQNQPIKSTIGESIDDDNYDNIIGHEKINNIFQKLKMNKILNTNESKKENQHITNYFKNLSRKIKKGKESDGEDNFIHMLYEEIECINNDNRIYNLNQNEKNNYVQNLSSFNRILQLKTIKKDNKEIKNKLNEISKENKKLKKELFEVKDRQNVLEKKFEEMQKIIQEKTDKNIEETQSIKKEVENIKNKIEIKEKDKLTNEDSNSNKQSDEVINNSNKQLDINSDNSNKQSDANSDN